MPLARGIIQKTVTNGPVMTEFFTNGGTLQKVEISISTFSAGLDSIKAQVLALANASSIKRVTIIIE